MHSDRAQRDCAECPARPAQHPRHLRALPSLGGGAHLGTRKRGFFFLGFAYQVLQSNSAKQPSLRTTKAHNLSLRSQPAPSLRFEKHQEPGVAMV
ncbi:MAG: hypothetical protein C5B53_02435 [Candidatus Melainabacteria bacterium]|nr:MAG: hypothetical protein C5B53_02435 [Candidatus Melainabacteria bacterium]